MNRFLLIDTDGETILATIGSMNSADAMVYAAPGQTVVAIAPGTDHGGHIADGEVKYDSVSGGLVNIADNEPADGFDDFALTEVVAP